MEGRKLLAMIMLAITTMAIGAIFGASMAGHITTAAYWIMLGAIIGIQASTAIIDWATHRKMMQDFDKFEEHLDALRKRLDDSKERVFCPEVGRLN